MTNQIANQLQEPLRSKAIALVDWVRSNGYPMIITSARRSASEQAALVAAGRSLTLRSKHLEGLAFDVDIQGVRRDDVPLWFWMQVGPVAERFLSLKWGGRWNRLKDYGHFEEPRA